MTESTASGARDPHSRSRLAREADDGAIEPREAGFGTIVLLSHLGGHLQLDLANGFRELGWEVIGGATNTSDISTASWVGSERRPLYFTPMPLDRFSPHCSVALIPLRYCTPHSYRYTNARVRRSQLFDIAVSCHPGAPLRAFARSHPRALLLPHAVVRRDYATLPGTRDLEVGWVGSSSAPIYKRRRDLLPILADEFVMNDWKKRYPPNAIPRIYARSKVVVNISRDDRPSDASTRVFEAMAAGALLITRLPTELTELGFVEGEHFIGYSDDDDVPALVAHWLGCNGQRDEITRAARARVLSSFTYTDRARTLAHVAVSEGAALVASRRLSEATAAALVLNNTSRSADGQRLSVEDGPSSRPPACERRASYGQGSGRGVGNGDSVDVKPRVDVSAGLRSSHVRMMRVTLMGVNQAPSAGEKLSQARVCIRV